jgi:hypothetical protein
MTTVEKTKKVILIRDDDKVDNMLIGKGPKHPEKLLGCEETCIFNAYDVDYSQYSVVLFYFNEDHSCNIKKFKDLAHFIRQNFKQTIIFNDPSICDIGDKYEFLAHVYKQGGIPGLNIPSFYKLTTPEDINRVFSYPCILKLPRGSQLKDSKQDNLIHNREELEDGFYKMIDYAEYLFCSEFVKPNHPDGVHTLVRFHFVNNTLIDIFCRPSDKWNIHNRDQKWDIVEKYDKKFKLWMQESGFDIKVVMESSCKLLGKGWYVMDCVWDGNKLYLVEIGYKLYIKKVSKLFNEHNINLHKLNAEGLEAVFKVLRKEIQKWGNLREPALIETLTDADLFGIKKKSRLHRRILQKLFSLIFHE